MNKNAATESPRNARPAQLVNIAEAARFLSVSPSTLYGWVWQRRIAFVKVGRAVRFDMRIWNDSSRKTEFRPVKASEF
jgi:excisionase family DNA binding protein